MGKNQDIKYYDNAHIEQVQEHKVGKQQKL